MIRSQALHLVHQIASLETILDFSLTEFVLQLLIGKLFVVAYRSKCLGIFLPYTTSVGVAIVAVMERRRSPFLPIIAKVRVATGEYIGTSTDHVLSECKLLAV